MDGFSGGDKVASHKPSVFTRVVSRTADVVVREMNSVAVAMAASVHSKEPVIRLMALV